MSPHEELFNRLLDESSSLLAAPEGAGITVPDDELHREIIVPLLPAMLADAAIRGHWSEQAATGFVARIGRHFENGESAPRWLPADFEIHVTASYSAGADARALADTLLSEESLRDLTAALLNQLLDAVWPKIAPQPTEAAVVAAEIPAPPIVEIAKPEARAGEEKTAIAEPAAAEISKPLLLPEPEAVLTLPAEIAEPVPLPKNVIERVTEITAVEFQAATRAQPSRALVRALCRKIAAADFQGAFSAVGGCSARAAIIARRISQHVSLRGRLSGRQQVGFALRLGFVEQGA